jgi:hypothetical protein
VIDRIALSEHLPARVGLAICCHIWNVPATVPRSPLQASGLARYDLVRDDGSRAARNVVTRVRLLGVQSRRSSVDAIKSTNRYGTGA